MNLVQINERLKGLPMQVIQQYANGSNPEVPPYLALGELQRREVAQKQMATAQGGMQGPQPSVKEQVEQKAGLLALQQAQQQQMAEQMMQPRGPMPTNENTPQPEPQPQPEGVMMASGGLASIPVRGDMFEYANGGIVAFADGGSSDKYETPYDRMNRKNRGEMTEEERKKQAEMEALLSQIPTGGPTVTGGERVEGSELGRNIQNTLMSLPGASAARALSGSTGSARGVLAALAALSGKETPEDQAAPAEVQRPAAPISRPTERMTPQQMEARMASTDLSTSRPASPRRSMAMGEPSAPIQAAPPIAPDMAQAGLPAASQNVSPFRSRLDELATKMPTEPTAEAVIAEVNKLRPAGMSEEAMQQRFAEQRARTQQERDLYERSRPSGLDDLIRVFGQAGQYKGLSGMAPAYTANQQQKRAEDLAFQRRQNELLSAIEGKEYEADKETFGARTKAMDTAQQLFGKGKESVIKATSDLFQVDQRRIDNELKLLSDKDIETLKMANQEKLKKMDIEQRERERKTQGAGANMAMEYVGLMAKSRELLENGDKAGAEKLAARANDIMTIRGGAGTAGVGAENAQTRMLRDALKDADSRLEFMSPKDPGYATLKQQRDTLSKRVYERAIKDAGGIEAPGGPKIGEVQQGFRFKGGNPADQSNWEKVK